MHRAVGALSGASRTNVIVWVDLLGWQSVYHERVFPVVELKGLNFYCIAYEVTTEIIVQK